MNERRNTSFTIRPLPTSSHSGTSGPLDVAPASPTGSTGSVAAVTSTPTYTPPPATYTPPAPAYADPVPSDTVTPTKRTRTAAAGGATGPANTGAKTYTVQKGDTL